MTVEAIECSPVQVVEEVFTLMQVRAQGKGISLKVEYAFPLPRFASDPLRLRQVLVNLVGNAIKFTEKGGVVVRVSAAPSSERREASLQGQLEDRGDRHGNRHAAGSAQASLSGLWAGRCLDSTPLWRQRAWINDFAPTGHDARRRYSTEQQARGGYDRNRAAQCRAGRRANHRSSCRAGSGFEERRTGRAGTSTSLVAHSPWLRMARTTSG